MSMGLGGAGTRGVATQECRLLMASRRRGLVVDSSVDWRAGTSRKEVWGLVMCWAWAESVTARRAAKIRVITMRAKGYRVDMSVGTRYAGVLDLRG
jgi:hypothetical protein